MNMHPEALAAMKRKVQVIAAQAVGRELTPFEYGMSWLRPGGTVTLPGSTALAFTELAESFAAKPAWSGKFSSQFVRDQMVPIILAFYDGDETLAGERLATTIETMETYDIEQTVYLPVSGVLVDIPEIAIGQIVLRAADHGLFQRDRDLHGPRRRANRSLHL